MSEAPTFRKDLLAAIPSLRAFAVSLSQNADRADDLVQETLVKAWDKQSSFQPGTNLKAWLFTILRNEFYSQMRKRGREVQDSDGAMTARLAIHPAQHGLLDLEDFRKALQLLPEDQREAIILIGASGFHTRKRPRFADAPLARSRAESAGHAAGYRKCSIFPVRPTMGPMQLRHR